MIHTYHLKIEMKNEVSSSDEKLKSVNKSETLKSPFEFLGKRTAFPENDVVTVEHKTMPLIFKD